MWLRPGTPLSASSPLRAAAGHSLTGVGRAMRAHAPRSRVVLPSPLSPHAPLTVAPHHASLSYTRAPRPTGRRLAIQPQHAHTHAHTHTRTHARTHSHSHTPLASALPSCCSPVVPRTRPCRPLSCCAVTPQRHAHREPLPASSCRQRHPSQPTALYSVPAARQPLLHCYLCLSVSLSLTHRLRALAAHSLSHR